VTYEHCHFLEIVELVRHCSQVFLYHGRDETNIPLSLRMSEAMWSSVLRTVIYVFQVGVLLDIDTDPPAVDQYHQDRDVLQNEKEKKAA
jgi:hypothetical protein